MPKGRVITEFRTRQASRTSVRALDRALKVVGKEMETAILKKIERQGPPRSVPGQPPSRDKGNLYNSVVVTSSKGVIRVRTVNYGLFLEGGTSNMDARPFVRPVLFSKGARTKWSRKIAKLAKQFSGGNKTKSRARRR